MNTSFSPLSRSNNTNLKIRSLDKIRLITQVNLSSTRHNPHESPTAHRHLPPTTVAQSRSTKLVGNQISSSSSKRYKHNSDNNNNLNATTTQSTQIVQASPKKASQRLKQTIQGLEDKLFTSRSYKQHSQLIKSKQLNSTQLSTSRSREQNSNSAHMLTKLSPYFSGQAKLNHPAALHSLASPNISNTPRAIAMQLTPTAGNSNATLSGRNRKPQLFTSKKLMMAQRMQPISSRINNINQGINKCLKQLEIRKFQVIKKLGKGVNGEVVLAKIRQLGWIAALKTFKKSSIHSKSFIEEVRIHSFISHPNIVSLYGMNYDKDNIYLIMELCGNNLFKQIRNNVKQTKLLCLFPTVFSFFSSAFPVMFIFFLSTVQKCLPEEKARSYIRQVISGLSYLHSHGIIHRDIKPENILNSFGVLKLCDFGWSVYTGDEQNRHMRRTFCGTFDYVSPQVSKGLAYDHMIDCWALGVLTYQMLTGTVPFTQKLVLDQEIIHFPKHVSSQAKSFITRFLEFEPSKRMDIQEALKHPWMLERELQEINLLNIKERQLCLAD